MTEELATLEKRLHVKLRVNENGRIAIRPKEKATPEVIAEIKARGDELRQLLLERQEQSKASPPDENGETDSIDAETGSPLHLLDAELATIEELPPSQRGPALLRFVQEHGPGIQLRNGRLTFPRDVHQSLVHAVERHPAEIALALPGAVLTSSVGNVVVLGRLLTQWPEPLSEIERRASTRLNLKPGCSVADAFEVLARNYLPYACWMPEQIRSAKAKLESQLDLDAAALGAGCHPNFLYVRTMNAVIEIPRLDA